MPEAALDIGVCECCRKEPAVGVAASAIGPISFAWGQNCLRAGVEPYWLLLGCFGDLGPDGLADWAQELLTRSLEYHGKTAETFWADAAKVGQANG